MARRIRRSDPLLLPQRLVERRTTLRMKVGEVYRRAGISRSYYHQLETKVGVCPSADVLDRLASVLETTPAYLLGGTSAGGLPVGGIPPELAAAGARLRLSNDDLAMLNAIHWRHARPQSERAWAFIAEAIRYSCE